jgi:predicted neuraminidase
VLVYNHVTPKKNEEDGWSDRSPLNVAISEDGINWKPLLILENEPKGEFSYPTVMQTADGNIHVTYTWKRKKVKHVVIKLT